MWLELFPYGWYAARFGWDPQQADRVPGWIDARLPMFMGVWDEVVTTRKGA